MTDQRNDSLSRSQGPSHHHHLITFSTMQLNGTLFIIIPWSSYSQCACGWREVPKFYILDCHCCSLLSFFPKIMPTTSIWYDYCRFSITCVNCDQWSWKGRDYHVNCLVSIVMEIVGEHWTNNILFGPKRDRLKLQRTYMSANRHNRVSPLHILKMEEQTQSSQYIVQGWALTTYTFSVPTA